VAKPASQNMFDAELNSYYCSELNLMASKNTFSERENNPIGEMYYDPKKRMEGWHRSFSGPCRNLVHGYVFTSMAEPT
jgi:hypothetical protein